MARKHTNARHTTNHGAKLILNPVFVRPRRSHRTAPNSPSPTT